MRPKIFAFVAAREGGDVVSYALSEDGHVLASHYSTDGYQQFDMGITSRRKHDRYLKHFPDGYDLEWVDNPNEHAGVRAAEARYAALVGASD